MSELSIEVGKTDGFRYVGIQPPLTTEQVGLLRTVDINLRVGQFVDGLYTTGSEVRTRDHGEPYLEFEFSAEGLPSSQVADSSVQNVAREAADVLTEVGN